jgi:hypothetical protein
MDPASLVLGALASGAARGAADSASDGVKAAYSQLKRLIADKFADNKSAELVLAEHAADPETWQAPLAKALADSDAVSDQQVIGAAQRLMELLDKSGFREGKYQVDLSGAQGVQVGDGNRQFNIFGTAPRSQ